MTAPVHSRLRPLSRKDRAAAARRRAARRAACLPEDLAAARAQHLVDYSPAAAAATRGAMGRLPVIFSIADDAALLPHFLRHYEAQGATGYLCVAWEGAPVEAVERALPRGRSLLIRPGRPFSLGYADAHLHDQIRAAHLAPEDWYLVADLDELHRVPGWPSLAEAVAAARADGAEAIVGEFVDRVARDGSLPAKLGPRADIEALFPLRARATRRLKTAATSKVLAAASHVAIHSGHHRCEAREWLAYGEAHHFAWRGELRGRMAVRLERVRELGLAWGSECERLIEALDENGGRLPLTLPPERPVPPQWRTQ